MPAEGLDWLPGPALLTDDEISRRISVAVRLLGITEVRFTGGEPLIRRGLPAVIAATSALQPRPEISLTTNGIGLARFAEQLAASGLDRLNVSLDTLSRQTFITLTRRDGLTDVVAGQGQEYVVSRPASVGRDRRVVVADLLSRAIFAHQAGDGVGWHSGARDDRMQAPARARVSLRPISRV